MIRKLIKKYRDKRRRKDFARGFARVMVDYFINEQSIGNLSFYILYDRKESSAFYEGALTAYQIIEVNYQNSNT